jgi:hypothetical protein
VAEQFMTASITTKNHADLEQMLRSFVLMAD